MTTCWKETPFVMFMETIRLFYSSKCSSCMIAMTFHWDLASLPCGLTTYLTWSLIRMCWAKYTVGARTFMWKRAIFTEKLGLQKMLAQGIEWIGHYTSDHRWFNLQIFIQFGRDDSCRSQLSKIVSLTLSKLWDWISQIFYHPAVLLQIFICNITNSMQKKNDLHFPFSLVHVAR